MEVKDHIARFESSQRTKAFLGQAVGRALYGAGWPAHVEAVGGKAYIPEITKALVAAATTGAAAFAGPLAGMSLFASAFLELVRPATIVDRLVGTMRAPMNVNLPVQTADDLPTADWVGESMPMPVAKFSFDTEPLPAAKIGIIVPFSRELAEQPSAQNILERVTVGALARGTDNAFLDPARAPVANVNPASITYGATVVPSTGSSAAAVEADVADLLAAVSDGAPAKPYVVTSQHAALRLATLRTADGTRVFPNLGLLGGDIFGVPLLVSASAESHLIAIDAAGIVVADAGVELDSSQNVALQMNDGPSPGPNSLVSLYQAGAVAIRAVRWISWERGADAVAYLHLPFGSPS
jgi:HK97 family phage major capsid protein